MLDILLFSYEIIRFLGSLFGGDLRISSVDSLWAFAFSRLILPLLSIDSFLLSGSNLLITLFSKIGFLVE